MDTGRRNEWPFVSVVVPVYNEARGLPECLEGLHDQSYPQEKYEVLVVDNGSTDNTRQIIERHPVRYLEETTTQSSYAARNTGLWAAKGDLLAFTDADCVPRPNWLSAGVEPFRDPKVGGVAGRILSGTPSNAVEEELKRRDWLAETATLDHSFLPYPQTANAFYRRSVFEAIGDFEETWVSGGDADLAWRMQLNTSLKVAHEPSAIVEHRHRSDLGAIFRQSIKWGHGSAQLERKYGPRAVPPDLRSVRQTILFLGRVAAGFVGRSVVELIRSPSSLRAGAALVVLASRGGRQLGLAYGRLSTSGQSVAGW